LSSTVPELMKMPWQDSTRNLPAEKTLKPVANKHFETHSVIGLKRRCASVQYLIAAD